MSVDAHYFSPTTPGASSFDVDVSDAIRKGRIGPLSKEAQIGAVGSGTIVLDDPDGTLGHDEDGILGLKQWYMNETTCPAGNRRFFTGYTFDRSYYRADSNVIGVARTVDVTLIDANAFLSFRAFAPEADDPTSSFNRPEEDHITRIQALLAVDFLSTTLFDLGYIPTTGGVLMSAKDYEGSRPVDVLNDCAQAAGWNGWVGYDETENKLFLWFDNWKTDGADTLPYDSTLKLTNVESERDDSITFLFEINARENRSPSRVVTAAYGTGTGVKSYRTRPTTAYTFGWRDMIAPSFFVKEQDKLDDLLDRYLADNSTEEIRIPLTVQLPVNKITAIKEGQRIQVHGTHMKSVADDFTWCRILHMSIRRDLVTDQFYWADLEVSPIVVTPECDEVTAEGEYPHNGSGTSLAPGNVVYFRGGLTDPGFAPNPGYLGDWHFPSWDNAGADYASAGLGNVLYCMVQGDGTIAIQLADGSGGDVSLSAELQHQDPITGEPVVDETQLCEDGDLVTFEVSSHDQTFCNHRVEFTYVGGAGFWGFYNFTWTPA